MTFPRSDAERRQDHAEDVTPPLPLFLESLRRALNAFVMNFLFTSFDKILKRKGTI